MAWVEKDGGLEQEFKFKDFVQAWTFMCRVAAKAEALDHHPDWSNSYNKVTVRLTTHDTGGLTNSDLELASEIDKILHDI